ncbi:MAG: hypothetical protein JWQ01_3229, partial [Massilia sp.]|nr:hypothetical protein [Massilia sp.]
MAKQNAKQKILDAARALLEREGA